jgi:hypothetical protein
MICQTLNLGVLLSAEYTQQGLAQVAAYTCKASPDSPNRLEQSYLVSVCENHLPPSVNNALLSHVSMTTAVWGVAS